jgi:hypothetical protein
VLAASASAEQCGDLDESGAVTSVDALRLLRAAVGEPLPLLCPPMAACGQCTTGEDVCYYDPDAVIEAEVPVVGEVATRGENRYRADGLVPGEPYTVSIHSLSRPGEYRSLQAHLHVFPDETYTLELDCTLVDRQNSCTLTTNGTSYFSVSAGEVNREGEVFFILVTR